MGRHQAWDESWSADRGWSQNPNLGLFCSKLCTPDDETALSQII